MMVGTMIEGATLSTGFPCPLEARLGRRRNAEGIDRPDGGRYQGGSVVDLRRAFTSKGKLAR
jgi:hypothetical protein